MRKNYSVKKFIGQGMGEGGRGQKAQKEKDSLP